MNICIIFTGTVASKLAPKIYKAFSSEYKVTPVFTKRSKYFFAPNGIDSPFAENFYDDDTEWPRPPIGGYDKKDGIPHVDLARENDVLLIIASADFLSKMANGICDDLASSIYRAWRRHKPVIVAPAMNSYMWDHPVTDEHLKALENWGVRIIPPQEKVLACGDVGMGALAEIDLIKEIVDEWTAPSFPIDIEDCAGIPIGENHPGSFLGNRKYSPHTGVDLYCENGVPVYSMDAGVVVSIEDFTGKKDNSPWWEDTKCILIQHSFGTVCYGEIEPSLNMKVGKEVRNGEMIGEVKRVLKPGKERPDIPGHNTSMLHVELYPCGQKQASKGYEQDKDILIDPTPLLKKAWGINPVLLKKG